jgi:hypothetical protein
MKAAATIRIIFVLILTLGFLNQHNGNICGSLLAGQEQTSQPTLSGNFSSHDLIDSHHGDDILSDLPDLTCAPLSILCKLVMIPVPAPVVAPLSPCWQPPDLLC